MFNLSYEISSTKFFKGFNVLTQYAIFAKNITPNVGIIEDYEEDISYFPPFYSDGKLLHFNQTDALLTFLMLGYELENININEEELSAKLIYNDLREKVHMLTKPDTFLLKFNIDNNDLLRYEVEGYSTKVRYKTPEMKKYKPFKLPEINDLFISYLTEHLNRLMGSQNFIYIL